MAHKFRDSYLAANLTFEDDKITWHCPEMNDTREVMMDWEQPIMSKMAEVAVEAGDHVLECGFGMGILSSAVQSRNPASHTIVECHPEIIIKAREWAADKSNVTIVEGKWMDLLSDRTKYNVILMDTYVDDDLHETFRYFCESKSLDNCKVSWWNFSGGTTDEWMMFYWDSVTFTEVTGLNPPENTYYNRDNYFVPLKILNRSIKGRGVLYTSNIHISAALETDKISHIGSSSDILSCADPSDPTFVLKQTTKAFKLNVSGVYKINSDLLILTGNQPMIIKRDGSWVDKKANELVVGDKLYKVDNTEVEITSIDFDSSNTVYEMAMIFSDDNYFVNDILIKKGDENA